MSNDRFCVYPPSINDPSSSTTTPPVHLDICPWGYNPDANLPRRDVETDPDLLTYTGDTRILELKDWRAEINCVRGENGPHHQGLISLLDNLEEDGGTVVIPKFHKFFNDWQKSLGSWEENRVGQRRRGEIGGAKRQVESRMTKLVATRLERKRQQKHCIALLHNEKPSTRRIAPRLTKHRFTHFRLLI